MIRIRSDRSSEIVPVVERELTPDRADLARTLATTPEVVAMPEQLQDSPTTHEGLVSASD